MIWCKRFLAFLFALIAVVTFPLWGFCLAVLGFGTMFYLIACDILDLWWNRRKQ